jgi:predicted GNAT superfamily acetyltransferase
MRHSIRPLTTLQECRQVAALEREVWALADAEDVVPTHLLVVSIKRGGILLGAFDERSDLKGFVYSIPAVRDGQLTHWSHLLGVAPEARGAGIGLELKRAQRSYALQMGIQLIEWTYDPLQAANAHLNLSKLGAVAAEYAENVYGESSSPLHRGTPTDRLVAEWRIGEPHVERRLADHAPVLLRDAAVAAAPVVNPARDAGRWLAPGDADLNATAPRLLLEIPTEFSGMQASAPDLALAWRLHTREIFQRYFGAGYRAVDFFLSQESRRGQYLLAR